MASIYEHCTLHATDAKMQLQGHVADAAVDAAALLMMMIVMDDFDELCV